MKRSASVKTIDRFVVTALLFGCVLLSTTCSQGPDASVAEHFIKQIAERIGSKVVEVKVIECGEYDEVNEYWPLVARVKQTHEDGGIGTFLYILKIDRDEEKGAWECKDWDMEIVVQ